MLLQSIRAGKALKKTVTVDKSAPAVSGKVKGEPANSSLSSNRENNGSNTGSSSVNTNNGAPMGLGGLFVSGMPKLKPIGPRGNTAEKDLNNVNNATVSHSSGTTHTIKRGPPPVPPPASQKPQVFSQGLSTTDSASSTDSPKGYGKPSLAPKPPQTPSTISQKPSPPPKKLNLTSGGSVSRAQSMRLPRSPPVLAPTPASLHQSQDCLNETQPRPTNRPLRPPVVKPPSPPTSRSNATATRAAPPPPSRLTVTAPCMPPPPPPLPHRPAPVHQRLAPPPPPPPTPPTRSSSMRNGQATLATVDLEIRFADLFHSIANFPPPDSFRGFPKVYSSRNAAKQQAPAPPLQTTTMPNAMVSLNTSSGG